MVRWRILAVALLLLLVLGQPALAQGGEGGRVVFGQDYTLPAGQRLDGDLVVFGGRVVVEHGATVRGSVVAFGGDVRIDGQVDGDLTTFGGQVSLGETAAIAGQLVTAGGTVEDRRLSEGREEAPPGDRVGSVRVRPWASGWSMGLNLLMRMLIWLVQTILLVVTMATVGVLVVVLVPGLAETASQALVAHPVESVGAGLLTGMASGLIVPVLVITCIGIPAAVVLVLGLALAAFFGWVVAGLTLGRRLLAAIRPREVRPDVAVAVGVSLLTLLARMPGLGPVFAILLGAWGLGAVVLTRFGTVRYTRSQAHHPSPGTDVGDAG